MLNDKFIKDHISFNSNRDIYDICEQFFKHKNVKINHCNIVQKYDDGTIHYLCSNRDWLVHYFNQLYPAIGAFEQNIKWTDNDFVLWDSLDSRDVILKDSREMISVDHGITIIKKTDESTVFYNLGNNESTGINNYVENILQLHQFVSFLEEKIVKIKQIAYDTRFILPTDISDSMVRYDANLAHHKNPGRLYLDDKVYFSVREVECLNWYVKGKSSTDIAQILKISNRTVETHVENAKLKSGCINMFQLGYMLAVLKFKNFGFIPDPY